MLFTNRKVVKFFKNKKFDIVHSNSSVINIGPKIAKEVGAKHVWHLREFGDLDYNLKTPISKNFQSVIYSGDNQFIAISQKILNHYKPYIRKQPIELIYNGLKDDFKIHLESGPVIKFCIVGYLHENKRQLDVLKAARELIFAYNIQSFEIYVVGDGQDDYKNILKSFVDGNNLKKHVKFLGQRKDIAEILSHMDVGIIASSNEAFGRVTIEYMMAQIAVIASDGGANEEIIDKNKDGLIFKTGDYKSLANSMYKYIINPDLRNEFASLGHKKAISKYTSIINSSKIYELYRKVCN